MTDGNTYAINKYLDDQEDYDALQEAEIYIDELEAKLENALGALEGVRSFVRDLGLYADQETHLAPALKKACNILEELEGWDGE